MTEIATGVGRRTRERDNIEKWDQTGSREIPDRGETSESPGLPSGVGIGNRFDDKVILRRSR